MSGFPHPARYWIFKRPDHPAGYKVHPSEKPWKLVLNIFFISIFCVQPASVWGVGEDQQEVPWGEGAGHHHLPRPSRQPPQVRGGGRRGGGTPPPSPHYPAATSGQLLRGGWRAGGGKGITKETQEICACPLAPAFLPLFCKKCDSIIAKEIS